MVSFDFFNAHNSLQMYSRYKDFTCWGSMSRQSYDKGKVKASYIRIPQVQPLPIDRSKSAFSPQQHIRKVNNPLSSTPAPLAEPYPSGLISIHKLPQHLEIINNLGAKITKPILGLAVTISGGVRQKRIEVQRQPVLFADLRRQGIVVGAKVRLLMVKGLLVEIVRVAAGNIGVHVVDIVWGRHDADVIILGVDGIGGYAG